MDMVLFVERVPSILVWLRTTGKRRDLYMAPHGPSIDESYECQSPARKQMLSCRCFSSVHYLPLVALLAIGSFMTSLAHRNPQ